VKQTLSNKAQWRILMICVSIFVLSLVGAGAQTQVTLPNVSSGTCIQDPVTLVWHWTEKRVQGQSVRLTMKSDSVTPYKVEILQQRLILLEADTTYTVTQEVQNTFDLTDADFVCQMTCFGTGFIKLNLEDVHFTVFYERRDEKITIIGLRVHDHFCNNRLILSAFNGE